MMFYVSLGSDVTTQIVQFQGFVVVFSNLNISNALFRNQVNLNAM